MREPSEIIWRKMWNTAAELTKAANSTEEWNKFGYTEFGIWQADYKRAQTDLHWLCTAVFGLALVDETHRRLTTDFFIKKNPYIVGTVNWIDDISKQSTIKNRLLLYPRSSFKTSIDKIDIVQWIICFPNIRTFIMTADEDLAKEFLTDTRKHFLIKEDEKLTRFQMLFGAHCRPAKERMDAYSFISRARTEEQEQPTIKAISIEQGGSGIHGDVGKFDDCINDKNSGPKSSEDGRKAIGQRLILARPLVNPYGYRDYIGTPYNDDDGYAILQEKLAGLMVMKEPCWKVQKGALSKKLDELTAEDVVLLFPQDSDGVPRLTFDFLMGEYKTDEYIFACQYLLNPQKSSVARFTEDMIRSHICTAEGLPQQHTDYSVWDLAYSVEDKRDYTVGSVLWVDEEQARGFITKLTRGRFSKGELPYQIASVAAQWKVARIAIEDSPGAQYLESDIRRELIKLNYGECPIEWIKVDTQKNAKNARAEGVENLLNQDRLWFSADLGEEDISHIVKEFTRFKPGSKRKDDIVDSVGHATRFIPVNPQPAKSSLQIQQRAWEIHAIKDEHDRIWNTSEWMANAPINLRVTSPMQNFQDLPMEFDAYPVACSYCGQAKCICR